MQKLEWATAQSYCKKERNCIAIQSLYCREEDLRVGKFYCNTADCIARMCSWLGRIVLQEGQLYYNRGSLTAKGTVLQYSLVGSRFVLQYKLYYEPGVGRCCDIARARQLGTLGAAGAHVGGAGRAGGTGRAARVRSRRRWHWRRALGAQGERQVGARRGKRTLGRSRRGARQADAG